MTSVQSYTVGTIHRAGRKSQLTHLAGDEEESGHVVPREVGLEAAAHLARHVLADVLAQQRLNVLQGGGAKTEDNQPRRSTAQWADQCCIADSDRMAHRVGV